MDQILIGKRLEWENGRIGIKYYQNSHHAFIRVGEGAGLPTLEFYFILNQQQW